MMQANVFQFSSNSTLDVSGVSLPVFPPKTDSLLSEMNITSAMVSAINSKVDPQKS